MIICMPGEMLHSGESYKEGETDRWERNALRLGNCPIEGALTVDGGPSPLIIMLCASAISTTEHVSLSHSPSPHSKNAHQPVPLQSSLFLDSAQKSSPEVGRGGRHEKGGGIWIIARVREGLRAAKPGCFQRLFSSLLLSLSATSDEGKATETFSIVMLK
jgi:hypothetical protein